MSASRLLLATIAVGGVASIAALWWWSEPPGLAVDRAGARGADERASSASAEARVDASDSRSRTIPADTTPTLEAVRESSSRNEPVAHEVHGSIVLVDESGREHHELDGWMRWRPFVEPPEPEAPRIEIRSGRFTTRLNSDCSVGVSGVVLGGRAADVEPDHLQVKAAETIALRAKWLPATPVRIVDRDEGWDLEQVTLLEVPDDLAGEVPRHPGDRRLWRVFRESIDSPIQLPAIVAADRVIGRKQLWIGAPGRSWDRTDMELGSGIPRWIELGPGADLTVSFRFSPAAQARLARMNEASRREELRLVVRKLSDGTDVVKLAERVHAELRSPVNEGADESAEPRLLDRGIDGRVVVFATPAAFDRVELPGVVPGALLVTLERRDRVIAATGVPLEPGESRDIELFVDAEPGPSAPLAGTVEVPPAWDYDDFMLDLDPPSGSDSQITRAEMTPVAGKPGWFRWTAGEVAIGRYFILLHPGSIVAEVDVPPEGLTDVHLGLAAPVDVEIRLIDAIGRGPLGPGHLVLRTDDPPGVFRTIRVVMSDGGLEVDSKGIARWRTVTPRAEVLAFFSGEPTFGDPLRCTFEPRTFELAPGQDVVEIAVEPRPAIVFFLLDGELRRPWQDANVRLGMTVTPLTGDGGQVEFGPDRCFLPSAGRYRLEFDVPPSWEPISPVEVDVARDATLEYDVRLVAKD